MSRPVYSSSLFTAELTDVVTGTYVVPDGFTLVLRELEIVASTGSDEGAVLTLRKDTIRVKAWAWPTLYALACDWQGRLVAPGLSQITFDVVGLGATVAVDASGYLLSAS